MDKLLYYDRWLSGAMSIKDFKNHKKNDDSKDPSSAMVANKMTLRKILILLEYSGHGVPWIGVTLLMIALEKDITTKQFYCNLLFALLFDLVVVGLLKVIVRRSRPIYNVDDMFATVSVDVYAFPSGHSTRAAMAVALLSIFWTKTIYIVLGYLWAGAVAASRVVLGRHHVSDVVIGLLIGYLQYCVIVKMWLSKETCMMLMAYQPIFA